MRYKLHLLGEAQITLSRAESLELNKHASHSFVCFLEGKPLTLSCNFRVNVWLFFNLRVKQLWNWKEACLILFKVHNSMTNP